MQKIRCRIDEGGQIVYRDCNNPKERKAAKEALTRTICNAEQKGQEDLNRSFTWDDMKQIEAVLERQEEIIEEQEKRIEDQEERIAIMTEGGWHKTTEEKPKLETDFPFESITVICADSKTKRTYPLKWCRRKVRGKIVYRWEYMYDNICYNEPDYWQYFPEPPKEGEA